MPPLFPPTELIGACGLSLEQPASQRLTSDRVAIRRKVKLGLPALIFPPAITVYNLRTSFK
ncbi:hypothetical protein [Erwinia sp. HR93]|uniref:hypothetical protein n=1 Tax=Erwinia sp. HR93 TaxID=3094840 RepID=UPI002ADEF223|nr:hypothetical protein [Erwinia sp. HR93]MEA1064196.1 hypothetical protein [Erwinia sp. HR93]